MGRLGGNYRNKIVILCFYFLFACVAQSKIDDSRPNTVKIGFETLLHFLSGYKMLFVFVI